MSVNNTVAGLNQTIGLLKQILDEIKSDKTIQPKSVSVMSSSTAKPNTESNTSNDLSSINTISPNAQKNANTLSSVVKTLSNKEVLNGLRSFSMARLYMISFKKTFKVLIDTINYLDELQIDEKKAKSFEKILNSINTSIKILPTLILSLVGVMVSATLIGILAPIAWKQILIGFSVISGIFLGVTLLLKLSSMMLNGIIFVESKNNNENVSNPKPIADVLKIFISIAGLIVAATAVGFLAQYMWPQIAQGFITIAAIITAVLLICHVSKKAINKDNTLALTLVVASLYAISLLVLVAWGIGELVQAHASSIIIGLSSMIIILAIVGLVLYGINALTDKKSLNGKTLNETIISVALISAVILSTSLLILTAWGIGELVQAHASSIIIGLSSMIIIIGVITMLLYAIGKLTDNKEVKRALIAGSAVIGGTTLLLSLLTGVIMKIVRLTERVKGEGGVGWNNVWQSVLSIAGIVTSFAVLFGALGAAAAVIGPILLIAIPTIMSTVVILDKILDVVIKILNVNKKIGEVDLNKVGTSIVNAFVKFAEKLTTGFANMTDKATPAMARQAKRLTKMIEPVMKFVEMIQMFAGDSNTLTLFNGEKVNLETIGTNIANMFSKFATQLSIGYDSIETGLWDGTKAKRLTKMIDPVSKFISILSDIRITASGDDITNVEVKGSDGKFIKVKNPTLLFKNISLLLEKFANSFELPNIKNNNTKSFRTAIDIVADSIKTLKDGSDVINSTTNSFEKTSKTISNLDNVLMKNEKRRLDAINKYKDAIKGLTDEIQKAADALVGIQNNSNIELKTTQTSSTTQSTSTVQTNNTSNSNNSSNFNYDEFGRQLLSAIGNNTIRVKFNNTTEDLIGELQII